MMEMTRDEAIHRLKLYDNGFSNYVGCFQEVVDCAIADMEKLEKIEQIVDSKAFHIISDNPNCVDSEHELRTRYNEICEVLEDGNK